MTSVIFNRDSIHYFIHFFLIILRSKKNIINEMYLKGGTESEDPTFISYAYYFHRHTILWDITFAGVLTLIIY